MSDFEISLYEAAGLAEIVSQGRGFAAMEAHRRLVQAYGPDGSGIFVALGVEDSVAGLGQISPRHASLRDWILLSRRFPEARPEFLGVVEEVEEPVAVPEAEVESTVSPVQMSPIDEIQDLATRTAESVRQAEIHSKAKAISAKKPVAVSSDLPESASEILSLFSLAWGLRRAKKPEDLSLGVDMLSLHKHAFQVAQAEAMALGMEWEESWVSVFCEMLEVVSFAKLAAELGSEVAVWQEVFGPERGRLIHSKAVEMSLFEGEDRDIEGILKEQADRLLSLLENSRG